MPIGILFWVLMVIWFIFGLWYHWPEGNSRPYPLASHVLVFVLIFLLGWKTFGFVVQ